MKESISDYLDRRVRVLQNIGWLMTTDEARDEINDIRAGLGLPALNFTESYVLDIIKHTSLSP